MRPLEHGPETFDPVGMGVVSDVFAVNMAHRFVIEGHAPEG